MIPGSGRSPGEGKGYPLQYSGLEKSLDSPWGHKESDTTERLSLFTEHIFFLDLLFHQHYVVRLIFGIFTAAARALRGSST